MIIRKRTRTVQVAVSRLRYLRRPVFAFDLGSMRFVEFKWSDRGPLDR